MSKVAEIAVELLNDPLNLGYGALVTQAPAVQVDPNDPLTNWTAEDSIHRNDIQQQINQNIADLLNSTSTGRTKNRTTVSTKEILTTIDPDELTALTDAVLVAKVGWVMSQGAIDPFNPTIVRIFTNAFSSTTLAALNALRTPNVSRAEELGLGFIGPGEVASARVINFGG